MSFLKKINKKLKGATDGKFFTTTKRGELAELKEELNSEDVTREKNALKKVIASMTLGRDVSGLYPDVVKLSRTTNLELKKLVYLYVTNNSHLAPDKAVMAVNTFVQDSQSDNAMIRALALRSMLCTCVDNVTEYATAPLRAGLRDRDAYVRKTACIGVLKLYASKPKYVEDEGFIALIETMVADPNPMVVSNAVTALAEIHLRSEANNDGRSLISIKPDLQLVGRLLTILPECTEWGQVLILDYISTNFSPTSTQDVGLLLDHVCPRLSHSNPSIVLTAVRLIIRYFEFASDEMKLMYFKKLAPPLVSLINSQPEMSYLVLRNILVIIQRYPSLVEGSFKAFFLKYTDPLYVKMEKLTVLEKLICPENANAILDQLKEYCNSIDQLVVERSVRMIGKVSAKVESGSARCVSMLMELVRSRMGYVVNEAIAVLVTCLRHSHGRFSDQAAEVFLDFTGDEETREEMLAALDTGAREGLAWMAGEFCDLPNANVLFDLLVDTFAESTAPVQMQILVASVKFFLKLSQEDLLQKVLGLCTTASDNPDLRDRAYIYWRLLANEGAIRVLHGVVTNAKPSVEVHDYCIAPSITDDLLRNLNTLAATYHRSPSTFVIRKFEDDDDDDEPDLDEEEGGLLTSPSSHTHSPTSPPTPALPQGSQGQPPQPPQHPHQLPPPPPAQTPPDAPPAPPKKPAFDLDDLFA